MKTVLPTAVRSGVTESRDVDSHVFTAADQSTTV